MMGDSHIDAVVDGRLVSLTHHAVTNEVVGVEHDALSLDRCTVPHCDPLLLTTLPSSTSTSSSVCCPTQRDSSPHSMLPLDVCLARHVADAVCVPVGRPLTFGEPLLSTTTTTPTMTMTLTEDDNISLLHDNHTDTLVRGIFVVFLLQQKQH